MRRFAICLALPLVSCASQSQEPNLVELTAALQNQFVKAKEPQELIARIRVGTKPLETDARRAIHLALVIDTSGSMEGEAISNARTAAIALVEALSDGDRISLITFHSTTDLIAPSTEIDSSTRLLLKRKLSQLEAKGTTDLAGGLDAAVRQLGSYNAEEIRRVVLLSDGIPNDPQQIAAYGDHFKNLGAPVTALGLGLEFDEALLATIALRSGGKFHFVEDSKMMASVFEEEVLRLDRTVAKNATLHLMPGPGVTIAGVIGRTPMAAGRGLEIPLGDLNEDENRDVLVRLTLAARADTAAVELMDAVLWFDDVAQAGRFERRIYLSAKSTTDSKKVADSEDLEVSRAYAKQEAAALTMQAINEARMGNASGSQATLQRAEYMTRENADRFSDSELQQALVDIIELQKARDERKSKRAYDNAMRLIY